MRDRTMGRSASEDPFGLGPGTSVLDVEDRPRRLPRRATTTGRWARRGTTLVIDLGGNQENLEAEQAEGEGEQELPVLRRGSKGEAVRTLQIRLRDMGRDPGPIDGDFGPRTDSAVRAFQTAQGIAVDGIVGAETWGRLLGPTPARPTIPGTAADRWTIPPDVRAAGEAQLVRYDGAPAWDGGRNCSGTFTAGAAELRRHILATFPGVTAIGGYSCRPNTANTSETSVHGIGRALDIMIPRIGSRGNAAVGDPIANWLVRNAAAIGIQYIIWNRVQWNGSRSGRKDNAYTGPNPHTDHIHAELNRDGAARTTPWFGRP